MKHMLLVRLMQIFFFLLPWQTRWIYDTRLIGGGASDFGIMSLYATELLLVFIFILASPLRIPRSLRSIALAALGVVAAAGFSLFVAPDFWLAANGWMHLSFAFLLLLLLLDERVDLREMLKAFVGGLIIPSLLGAFQTIFGGSAASSWLGLSGRAAQQFGDAVVTLGDGTRIERAYGSFSHPNIFGGYLTTALLALLWLWKGERSTGMKRTFLFAFGWFAFVLAITCSRSAWLGLFVGLCLGVWFSAHASVKRLRAFALPLAGMAFAVSCAIFFAVPSVQQRFTIGDSYLAPSVTERVAQYMDYGTVMQGSWMFGHGLANYPLTVNMLFFDRVWWQYQPIHNVPLLIVGELGIIGGCLVFLFLGLIDRKNHAHANQSDAMVAFSFAAALLPIALLDHYLWSFWSGLALCALVMACTARFGSSEK